MMPLLLPAGVAEAVLAPAVVELRQLHPPVVPEAALLAAELRQLQPPAVLVPDPVLVPAMVAPNMEISA
jgi:hypothetical protein